MSDVPIVTVDDAGVWCENGPTRRWGIRWEEIARVNVGKIDAIDVVDTSVEFDFDFGEYFEINSTFPGFEHAMEVVCKRLVGVPRDWRELMERLRPGDSPVLLWQRHNT